MIEPLESRIAPATLTGRVLKYIDTDGDAVTVTFTKGTLADTNFTFNNTFGTTGAQELQKIDVSGVADVDMSNLTVAVKKAATGDGIANIGAIIATGHDLGAVKVRGNLGGITAGNNAQPAPGLASLSVGTLGIVGTANQAPGSMSIAGPAGSVTIAGDLGGFLGATGVLTALKIGGSVIGDGRLFIDGNLPKATIGGSIDTDPTTADSDLYVHGNLGTLMIRGSVIAGTLSMNLSTPQIQIDGNAGSITIGGDVRGPTGGFTQPNLRVDGTVGSLTIGGSVIGADGTGASLLLANNVNVFNQGVGSVLIKGSASNMLLGVSLALTNSQSIIKTITINGSFISSGIAVSGAKGADMKFGTLDDTITPSSVIGSLTIKGAVYGTASAGDSFAINAGKVMKATISGRLLPLTGATQTLSIASSGDTFVRDVA